MLTNVKGRDRSTLRQHGPCLTCGVEIQYGRGEGKGLAGVHVQYGDAWLEQKRKVLARRSKPFLFARPSFGNMPDGLDRCRLIVLISTSAGEFPDGISTHGSIDSINGIKYSLLKPYICGTCRAEMEARLTEFIEEARLQEVIEIDTKRYEATWRRPGKGEFSIETNGREFALVDASLSFRNIRFQWRTSKLFCRGSSPAFVMMMTVDGALAGKCYRVYGSTRGNENESIDMVEDAATGLLVKWIQENLQSDLGAVDPLFAWDSRNPDGRGFYNGQGTQPGVLRTVWIDGSRYAALIDFHKLSEVSAFLKDMTYKLIEQKKKGVPGWS